MKSPQKIKADVVVVGSGPGGATVARDLTLKGKKVVILELGGDNKPAGNLKSFLEFVSGTIDNRGKGVMFTSSFLMMIRAITLGGTSMMYTASAWDPPYEQFKKYGVNFDPEETEKIKKELHVAPLPDSYIGPAAAAIMDSALDLGYKWEKISKFVDTSKQQPVCNDFFCGSKNGIKWEAREWVLEAVENGATLLTNTYCEDIIVENNVATGVRASGRFGRKYEISANAVVVSAGGVGSPTILQRSGIYDAGNKFFFDPFVVTYGYLNEDRIYPTDEIPMSAGMHTDDGIMITDMRNPWFMYHLYTTAGLKPHKMFSQKRLIGLMTKIADDMDGSISITGRVTKSLTQDDRYKLNKGKAISRKILRNMDAQDIWYSIPAAAHPGGTCRIGTIVDENLETEYKNLYVSDASVIPEQFGLPPVLTVLSLSRRLSQRLLPVV